MTVHPNEKARIAYADRWADYLRYGLDTTSVAPIGFAVDTRTEEDARQIAAKLAHGPFDISRRWWPFGRRWRLLAKSQPVTLDRPTVDAWFHGVLVLLQRYDAEFVLWVPTEPARMISAA